MTSSQSPMMQEETVEHVAPDGSNMSSFCSSDILRHPLTLAPFVRCFLAANKGKGEAHSTTSGAWRSTSFARRVC